MIFKQRFFTALLGLLFATVLTDQASALYDPGVGRFCSRDPIDLVGTGESLFHFVFGNPATDIDPTGMSTVSPADVDESKCLAKYNQRVGRPGMHDDWARAHCRHCAKMLRKWIEEQNSIINPSLAEILGSLPDCPCDISCRRLCNGHCCRGRTGKGHPTECLPDDDKAKWGWDFAVDYPLAPKVGYNIWSFHPGAHRCMRSSRGDQNVPNQQCCYDKSGKLITNGPGAGSPDINKPDHYVGEVDPFLCAVFLDGNDVNNPGHNTDLYNRLRPTNNGKNCQKNP
ncbi:MAG: hypothetical protein JNK90_15755 [Planctomycetaceae bacterium]|nr:hypothetical protein [Planctomycetaceae bacterium]